MDKTARMKELIPLLNEAAKAYYQEDREIMSNFDYDKLYDELVLLERETGITLTGSPTAMVGYEALDELQKEAHESPRSSKTSSTGRTYHCTYLPGRQSFKGSYQGKRCGG